MGEGVSVTKFFKAPRVTLWSNKTERLSASDFWASLVVMGEGLSRDLWNQ